jgi:steroid delta-isomerase-like uncharacterized protein
MNELVKKHLASLDASDWNTFQADFATGFEYEGNVPGKRVSADELLATAKKWKVAFPDMKTTVLHDYEAGDDVVAEVEWTGTQKGVLEAAFGTVPASNKAVRVPGVMIYRLKDGKFTESRGYYDALGLLKQLGVMPAIGAPAAKGEAEKRVVH